MLKEKGPDEAPVDEALDQNVAELQAQLEAQVHAVRRSNRVTLIVGIVLAVIIGVYLYVLTGLLGDYVGGPKAMAELAQGVVVENLPAVAANIEQNLKDSAPDIVSNSRAALLDGIPGVRKELETTATKRLVDRATQTLQAHMDELVSDMISRDRAMIGPLITKAETVKGAARLTTEFERSFQKTLGDPLKQELDKGCNRDLRDAVTRLRRLRTGRDLTPDEKWEKQTVTKFMDGLAGTVVDVAQTQTKE